MRKNRDREREQYREPVQMPEESEMEYSMPPMYPMYPIFCCYMMPCMGYPMPYEGAESPMVGMPPTYPMPPNMMYPMMPPMDEEMGQYPMNPMPPNPMYPNPMYPNPMHPMR